MNATIVIECPNCGTKYKVIEGAVKPRGRTVHCTQCQNKWHVEPAISAIDEWEERFRPDPIVDSTEASEDAGSETEHELAHAEDAPAQSERFPAPPIEAGIQPDSAFMVATPQILSESDHGHSARTASLGLLAASLFVLVAGSVALHSRIEHLWPASVRLYQVVGLDPTTVAGQGLELQDVHALLANDGQAQTLTIEAKVVNPQKTAIALPSLSATLVSAGGPSRHWTFDAGTQKLDPGATATAKASFDGANTENGKILLTFSADNSVESK